MLNPGDFAPAFQSIDQHGYVCSLETLLRDGPLVLYFYPRDFSFVCTREACAFRDEHQALTFAGGVVCGVSADSMDSHERFTAENDIPYPLVSDEAGDLIQAYDVKSFFGMFAKRVTYVIAQDRRIASVHHHELSARRHIEEVQRSLVSLGLPLAQAS